MNTMIFFSRSLLSLVLLIICAISIFFPVSVSAASLAADEVDVLKQIGKTLGKKDWDFSVDPCSKEKGWVTQNPVKGSENAVNCTCSFNNNTVCHITSIVLKSQNLSGTLPTELVNLPYLQEIDFSRNYLNGTIPPEWGSTQLRNISLIVNRLTGPIPKELGNISTLLNLTVEFNQLSGLIPPEIGNLSRLEILHLSSNNFTGELPETLSKLTNLKEIRLSDNHFTGKIPNFIQSWTNLDKLVMHASGLEGPIPPGIRLLTKITDLRISDLNGTQAPFPPLNDMTSLKYLILRNCNLNESLPEYLGAMTSLKTLDLSFNKLSGEIPGNFSSLAETDNIFLTRNLLSGPVPSWILEKAENVDLSFNNFTPSSGRCQEKQVNLFGSSLNGNTGILSCLSSTHCSRTWHSFHINCGGSKVVNVGSGTKYEADATPVATSLMVTESNSNWGFSSTGDFMDQGGNSKSFIQKNTSILSVKDPELYMDARLSPISLAYYGFCLKNENYKVNLHFAEIMFTDDKTYSSLGRRVFDIYIQGKLVEKDFNIVDKAGGASKSITMPYDATVTNGTLEIRFYWAGRGTTAVPVKGVYGPLISAISVDSEGGNGMSAGAVVGIVAAVAFVIILLLGILWWRGCLRRKDTMDEDLKGLDLQTSSFTLRQIKAATNNFDATNKIGEGGFGFVYKGLLADGTTIAVKQLSSKSKQGNREFVNEIGMVSALEHPHLVKLYGCCIANSQLLLVYEYMENNSLARALFGPEEFQLKLDWQTRYKICIGIARGLAFLHEESRLKIVHRDIKATNVLLDKNLNPKISDFGLAKLDEEDNTHISTRIAGTYGYMAPEYAMHGYLTDKADVYSFGIVALEIASGRSNTSFRAKEPCFNLLDRTLELKAEGRLTELVDPKLGSAFNRDEAMVMIDVALLCTNAAASVRPAMSSVVSMLEGRTVVKEPLSYGTKSHDQVKFKGKMDEWKHSQETKMTEDSQIQGMPIDGPWTGSSASAGDLYPISLNSDYWKNRD
ncbi:probable leucine-rich repeat receptor-like serine/threonine-protein kinase At3g14840 isoform X1 [Diospyros lotus]|uniref:probable leucine-rich repeat receptor-like serine/threonine-protein kinase At3g14840 isoform X1 n=1 Tax=Diospyros lotus TaxID=55363 RepID=UPI00225766B0|nr:probable leucine-rich repeat receptor-like serine/threonine-protein kinase At3g14840 isoform X1 [Diospyros lotus]